MSKYYDNNKEKISQAQRVYNKSEAGRLTARRHSQKRYAQKKSTIIGNIDFTMVYEKYQGICYYCNKIVKFSECDFDHYIPLARGGEHVEDNIRVSCKRCNRKKGAKLPSEWEVQHQMV